MSKFNYLIPLLLVSSVGCASTTQADATRKMAIGGGLLSAGITTAALSATSTAFVVSQTPNLLRQDLITAQAPLIAVQGVVCTLAVVSGVAMIATSYGEINEFEKELKSDLGVAREGVKNIQKEEIRKIRKKSERKEEEEDNDASEYREKKAGSWDGSPVREPKEEDED